MSELVAATREPSSQPVTLLSMPGQKLDDGTFRLASGKAFVVLEKGAARTCGSYVNEHDVELLRMPAAATTPGFQLRVHPREGKHERCLPLDRRTRITPALDQLRRETHFIKPDGERLLRAVAMLDGKEVELCAFDVTSSSGNPLRDLFGRGRQSVRLGFRSLDDALGWYCFLAACARLMDENDADLQKVIGRHKGLTEHAAAAHAPILQMHDA